MNANNSFRTSITVLTVATIVGCVVILLSGLSKFRLRSFTDDKAMVSSADQKLRNRFGEFYPVERRLPVAESGFAATSSNKSAQKIIHSASQISTFNEVVTTTPDDDRSEYESAEVLTSWTSGTSAGTPQVSVPVTVNVNNGDLMATLIETREKLAEMKVQQSALRDDQRVFSYQVHKSGSNTVTSSGIGAAVAGSSVVRATSSESSVPEPLTSPSVNAEVKTGGNSSPTPKTPDSNIEEDVSFEPIAPPQMPAAEADDDTTVPVIEPISYFVEETVDESARGTHSTRATESARVRQAAIVSEETVVQFPPLDEVEPDSEAPASLPELSFEQSLPEESSDVPLLSIESKAIAIEASNSDAVTTNSKETSAEPTLPDFFAADTNPASVQNVAAAGHPEQSSTTESSTTESSAKEFSATEFSAIRSARTREELSKTFAAVRGLPPEDLFSDRETAFVKPMDPAEPVPQTPVPEVPSTEVPMPPVTPESSGLASTADSSDDEKASTTTPPTISFIESAGDRLVVRATSAASPVELEFGEPSAPSPGLSQSENPGSPTTPSMPLADQKPERWLKYRSRIHEKYGSSPSTPVPPIPEIAVSEMPELPGSSIMEPALVPPVIDNSLAESGLDSSDIGNTITDSPLMIPDEDGTTEIAQNSDSEKLSSSSLPPIPELAPVPVPGEKSTHAGNKAQESLVYEPQPVMDRINEIHSEMNSAPSPMVSSASPMMAPRAMPQKSGSNLPFATTFRRIHKRVAWMSDAMHSPEKKTAQHSPNGTSSPTTKRNQPGIPRATQKHGPAVAKKSSPSQPMQLPKLTLPKFTVQNFALPKVNFQPIQAPSLQMPMLDTPDWLACPPDVFAPVRNSTALHRVMSTVQFAGQPQVLK
jgi:hypothetical protein